MLYLLDTNVISELVKPTPNASVVAWVRGLSPIESLLSVLAIGEIEKGVSLLPAGERRSRLTHWLRTDLPAQFAGRVLPVDEGVALAWGQLTAAGHAAGRPLPVVDGLMLATARVHGLTLATRNVSDCAAREVPVFDPWSGALL